MTPAALRNHPAYLALSADEQAAVDARLQAWHLDTPAVAAHTGGVGELDAGDLRFWLASTARRPWAMITLGDQPATADAVFAGLLDAAPGLAEHPARAELVALARDLGRAVVVAEAARTGAGFVRDEQLAALWRQIERLRTALPAWTSAVALGVLRAAGLAAIADAVLHHRRETTGVRGFFDRLGQRLRTHAFDLGQGGRYLATGAPAHEGRYEDGVWRNWTANYEVRPRSFHCPRSEEELARIIAGAAKLRVVGGGHSFNDSPLSPDTLVSLDAYDDVLDVDREAKTIRAAAGIRLRDLNQVLWSLGLGLPALGSTDAQSLGGLIATDLHGTGRDHGFLSEQVRSLRVLGADGGARTVGPGDPLFHAALGGLGTCGVVAEVELQLVDAFNVEKATALVDRVATEAEVEALLRANDHVSFYYVGGARDGESIRLHRWNHTDAPLTEGWREKKTLAELTDFGISAGVPWIAELIADLDEDAWLSNLLAPDHRLIMPGAHGFGRKLFYAHDELEYGVPFASWRACLGEVMALLRARDFFSIVEVRFTPDTSKAMLGPGVGRPTAYIELATPLSQPTDAIYAAVEDILRAHGGQPHLGKKTNLTAQGMLEIFGARYTAFQAVRAAQDPTGKFLNAFTERLFGAC